MAERSKRYIKATDKYIEFKAEKDKRSKTPQQHFLSVLQLLDSPCKLEDIKNKRKRPSQEVQINGHSTEKGVSKKRKKKSAVRFRKNVKKNSFKDLFGNDENNVSIDFEGFRLLQKVDRPVSDLVRGTSIRSKKISGEGMTGIQRLPLGNTEVSSKNIPEDQSHSDMSQVLEPSQTSSGEISITEHTFEECAKQASMNGNLTENNTAKYLPTEDTAKENLPISSEKLTETSQASVSSSATFSRSSRRAAKKSVNLNNSLNTPNTNGMALVEAHESTESLKNKQSSKNSSKLSLNYTEEDKISSVHKSKRLVSNKDTSTPKTVNTKNALTPKTLQNKNSEVSFVNFKDYVTPKVLNNKNSGARTDNNVRTPNETMTIYNKELKSPKTSNIQETVTPKIINSKSVNTKIAKNKEAVTPNAFDKKHSVTPRTANKKDASTPRSNDKSTPGKAHQDSVTPKFVNAKSDKAVNKNNTTTTPVCIKKRYTVSTRSNNHCLVTPRTVSDVIIDSDVPVPSITVSDQVTSRSETRRQTYISKRNASSSVSVCGTPFISNEARIRNYAHQFPAKVVSKVSLVIPKKKKVIRRKRLTVVKKRRPMPHLQNLQSLNNSFSRHQVNLQHLVSSLPAKDSQFSDVNQPYVEPSINPSQNFVPKKSRRSNSRQNKIKNGPFSRPSIVNQQALTVPTIQPLNKQQSLSETAAAQPTSPQPLHSVSTVSANREQTLNSVATPSTSQQQTLNDAATLPVNPQALNSALSTILPNKTGTENAVDQAISDIVDVIISKLNSKLASALVGRDAVSLLQQVQATTRECVNNIPIAPITQNSNLIPVTSEPVQHVPEPMNASIRKEQRATSNRRKSNLVSSPINSYEGPSNSQTYISPEPQPISGSRQRVNSVRNRGIRTADIDKANNSRRSLPNSKIKSEVSCNSQTFAPAPQHINKNKQKTNIVRKKANRTNAVSYMKSNEVKIYNQAYNSVAQPQPTSDSSCGNKFRTSRAASLPLSLNNVPSDIEGLPRRVSKRKRTIKHDSSFIPSESIEPLPKKVKIDSYQEIYHGELQTKPKSGLLVQSVEAATSKASSKIIVNIDNPNESEKDMKPIQQKTFVPKNKNTDEFTSQLSNGLAPIKKSNRGRKKKDASMMSNKSRNNSIYEYIYNSPVYSAKEISSKIKRKYEESKSKENSVDSELSENNTDSPESMNSSPKQEIDVEVTSEYIPMKKRFSIIAPLKKAKREIDDIEGLSHFNRNSCEELVSKDVTGIFEPSSKNDILCSTSITDSVVRRKELSKIIKKENDTSTISLSGIASDTEHLLIALNKPEVVKDERYSVVSIRSVQSPKFSNKDKNNSAHTPRHIKEEVTKSSTVLNEKLISSEDSIAVREIEDSPVKNIVHKLDIHSRNKELKERIVNIVKRESRTVNYSEPSHEYNTQETVRQLAKTICLAYKESKKPSNEENEPEKTVKSSTATTPKKIKEWIRQKALENFLKSKSQSVSAKIEVPEISVLSSNIKPNVYADEKHDLLTSDNACYPEMVKTLQISKSEKQSPEICIEQINNSDNIVVKTVEDMAIENKETEIPFSITSNNIKVNINSTGMSAAQSPCKSESVAGNDIVCSPSSTPEKSTLVSDKVAKSPLSLSLSLAPKNEPSHISYVDKISNFASSENCKSDVENMDCTFDKADINTEEIKKVLSKKENDLEVVRENISDNQESSKVQSVSAIEHKKETTCGEKNMENGVSIEFSNISKVEENNSKTVFIKKTEQVQEIDYVSDSIANDESSLGTDVFKTEYKSKVGSDTGVKIITESSDVSKSEQIENDEITIDRLSTESHIPKKIESKSMDLKYDEQSNASPVLPRESSKPNKDIIHSISSCNKQNEALEFSESNQTKLKNSNENSHSNVTDVKHSNDSSENNQTQINNSSESSENNPAKYVADSSENNPVENVTESSKKMQSKERHSSEFSEKEQSEERHSSEYFEKEQSEKHSGETTEKDQTVENFTSEASVNDVTEVQHFSKSNLRKTNAYSSQDIPSASKENSQYTDTDEDKKFDANTFEIHQQESESMPIEEINSENYVNNEKETSENSVNKNKSNTHNEKETSENILNIEKSNALNESTENSVYCDKFDSLNLYKTNEKLDCSEATEEVKYTNSISEVEKNSEDDIDVDFSHTKHSVIEILSLNQNDNVKVNEVQSNQHEDLAYAQNMEVDSEKGTQNVETTQVACVIEKEKDNMIQENSFINDETEIPKKVEENVSKSLIATEEYNHQETNSLHEAGTERSVEADSTDKINVELSVDEANSINEENVDKTVQDDMDKVNVEKNSEGDVNQSMSHSPNNIDDDCTKLVIDESSQNSVPKTHDTSKCSPVIPPSDIKVEVEEVSSKKPYVKLVDINSILAENLKKPKGRRSNKRSKIGNIESHSSSREISKRQARQFSAVHLLGKRKREPVDLIAKKLKLDLESNSNTNPVEDVEYTEKVTPKLNTLQLRHRSLDSSFSDTLSEDDFKTTCSNDGATLSRNRVAVLRKLIKRPQKAKAKKFIREDFEGFETPNTTSPKLVENDNESQSCCTCQKPKAPGNNPSTSSENSPSTSSQNKSSNDPDVRSINVKPMRDAILKFLNVSDKMTKTINETLERNQENFLESSSSFEETCLDIINTLSAMGDKVEFEDMEKLLSSFDKEQDTRRDYKECLLKSIKVSQHANMILYNHMLQMLSAL